MIKQFIPLIKFGVVGMFNTGIDLLVFACLISAGMAALPAQWISYSCGMLNSYVWNRSWTFKQTGKRNFRELLRFACLNLVALLAASAVLEMSDHLSASLVISKILATIVSVLINYAGSRYWVFGSLGEKRESA